MIEIIIIIALYILGFIVIRYGYRLQSSKYAHLLDDEDCKLHIFWFLPLFNLVLGTVFIITALKSKGKPKIKNKTIRKIFNLDITDKN